MERVVQWLNSNRYRQYPFVSDTRPTYGGITLPTDAVLDCRGTVYGYPAQQFRLYAVVVPASAPPRTVTFVFRLANVSTSISVAVPESSAFPYTTTVFAADRYRITFVFGEGVVALAALAAATYTVNLIVEPALISFLDAHRVESVQAAGGAQTEVLTGILQCVEGYNCSVLIGASPSRVRLSAVRGAGAGIPCDSLDPSVVLCGQSLLRINGLAAGQEGGFMLLGGDGIEVVPDPTNNRLIIRARANTANATCEGQ